MCFFNGQLILISVHFVGIVLKLWLSVKFTCGSPLQCISVINVLHISDSEASHTFPFSPVAAWITMWRGKAESTVDSVSYYGLAALGLADQVPVQVLLFARDWQVQVAPPHHVDLLLLLLLLLAAWVLTTQRRRTWDTQKHLILICCYYQRDPPFYTLLSLS